MKIIYDKELLKIGSAGLRCGRWALKHGKEKTKQAIFDRAYHTGKMYAYLYTLSLLGYTEVFNPKRILDIKEFLKRTRKGWRVCWYNEICVILMKGKFFDDILNSKQPHQGKNITKEMRKMFYEIK